LLRVTIVTTIVVGIVLSAGTTLAQPAGADVPASQPTSAPASQPAAPASAPASQAAVPDLSVPDRSHTEPGAATDEDDLFADAPDAMEAGEAATEEASAPALFVLNGYIQGQAGIFTDGQHHNRKLVDKGDDEYWADHGDLMGKLSMMRAVLQLEGDFTPSRYASLHFVLRGARSLRLDADSVHAEPPEGAFAGDPSKWAQETYYNETDLRELFVDINPASWVNFRVGRQQVAWGDLGQYRLLDVINPTNSTWHFSTLESYEDSRIPLWIFKTLLDVRPLRGSVELVWVPMIDRPEDTVTVPLTFVGAWGLPLAGPREHKSSFDIKRKIPIYPGRDIEDTRLGLRWLGSVADISYTLVYYWTHQLSPPVPTGFYQRWDEAQKALEGDVEVILEFPRQHIMGFSVEYMFKDPVSTIFRLEASYTPNAHYAGASVPAGELFTDDFVVGQDLYTRLPTFEKHVASYGVQLMRPTFIRFLNPKQTFMLVGQLLHSIILDFDSSERMVSVPGYDSTLVGTRHSFTVVGAIVTDYLHGMLRPSLVGAYIPQSDAHSGFLSARLGILLGNSLRMLVGYTSFFGQDPYKGLGLFRDRDEAFLRVTYQF